MINIPLQARLKRETHRKIAYAQDRVVKEVGNIAEKSVLHGGTAIWRCYSGKRFSEDLDFYFPNSLQSMDLIFKSLEKIGFKIMKKKISERSVYSELDFNGTIIRLEGTFQNIKGIICDYEMSDGNIIPIYSLSPEDFVAEKCKTYLKRLKIRDLWDVFFLLKILHNPRSIKEIGSLVKNFKKPVDEDNLKVIILEGIVPSYQEMIDYIKRKWENKFI
jgi:predicted nucleotidyltransferase component of viral defense system